MKLGYAKEKGLYYVGWCDRAAGKVVYTWFPSFQQAVEFMHREG